jgi:hypothetical protein
MDEAVSRYSYVLLKLSNLPFESVQGCQADVEVWQRILQVRSLVLQPQDDPVMWIKFANLCRKSGRMQLADKTISSLLPTKVNLYEYGTIPSLIISVVSRTVYGLHQISPTPRLLPMSFTLSSSLCGLTTITLVPSMKCVNLRQTCPRTSRVDLTGMEVLCRKERWTKCLNSLRVAILSWGIGK